jgi:hypothetical protein
MALTGGAVDDQEPLFTAAWIADYSTQVTTAAPPLTAVPGAGALRLTAVPGITRTGTELRASRPFERATAVLIHDVTGRRVASLPAIAGARSVRWDGRGTTGERAAAGVYFARIEGRPGQGTSRIVLVR